MITIKRADEAFLRQVKAPADSEAMVLRDGDGAPRGYALFRVDAEAVELLAVEAAEPLLAEGLVRSVLNVGDCRGALTGVCAEPTLFPLVRRLEFREKDGRYEVSIDAFFRTGCHHEGTH